MMDIRKVVKSIRKVVEKDQKAMKNAAHLAERKDVPNAETRAAPNAKMKDILSAERKDAHCAEMTNVPSVQLIDGTKFQKRVTGTTVGATTEMSVDRKIPGLQTDHQETRAGIGNTLTPKMNMTESRHAENGSVQKRNASGKGNVPNVYNSKGMRKSVDSTTKTAKPVIGTKVGGGR